MFSGDGRSGLNANFSSLPYVPVMKDIQSQTDHRRINIKKVGVKDISYPITVLDKAQKVQRTVARVNMYVNLPHRFKGTHMSRFIEILNRFRGEINLKSFHHILQEMKERLDAPAAHVEIEFPYFLKKAVQHPDAIGRGEYRCKMHGSLTLEDDLTLEVRVPIGASRLSRQKEGLPRSSGQWGAVDVSLRCRQFIWMEDIIQIIEKVIAEQQYLGVAEAGDPNETCGPLPLSVEQLAKALSRSLSQHQGIRWFAVTVENMAEGYSTFASLEWPENEVLKATHERGLH